MERRLSQVPQQQKLIAALLREWSRIQVAIRRLTISWSGRMAFMTARDQHTPFLNFDLYPFCRCFNIKLLCTPWIVVNAQFTIMPKITF